MSASLQPQLDIEDLGRVPYAEAYAIQVERVERVLAARAESRERPFAGTLLIVEHPPVVTISNRPTAMENLLASPELLARHGVDIERTDRGGDITYHGPGQLVVYPILDLNELGLSLHAYMRFLEQVVIDTCRTFAVEAHRDTCATGVWVAGEPPDRPSPPDSCQSTRSGAKLCAMGVRIKRWVSMHGLALNVTTNLDHFALIVPCGLAGRPVTSLRRILGPACPSMADVKAEIVAHFNSAVARQLATVGTRPSAVA